MKKKNNPIEVTIEHSSKSDANRKRMYETGRETEMVMVGKKGKGRSHATSDLKDIYAVETEFLLIKDLAYGVKSTSKTKSTFNKVMKKAIVKKKNPVGRPKGDPTEQITFRLPTRKKTILKKKKLLNNKWFNKKVDELAQEQGIVFPEYKKPTK